MPLKMFGAITIGSTETELKIFEYTSKRAMKEVERLSTRLNLGMDTYTLGRLSSRSVEQLCTVLRDFRRVLTGYGIADCRACATSAFRESRNMLIMKDYIEKQTGFPIEVLSNSEHRFLDYKAIASVTSEFESIIQNPAAFVDIGADSMQISLFDKDKLITTQNIRMGNLTTQEWLGPLAKNSRHFAKMVSELLSHELAGFNKLYQKDRQIKNLIVVGGNLPDLMKKSERGSRQIPSVQRSDLQPILDEVMYRKPEEIAMSYDTSAERASVIGLSALICTCLADNFGVDTLWFPGFSLGDGMAYDYGVKKKYIQGSHNFDEDIIAAARSISKRYKCSQAHIKNLEGLALQVFDRMKKVHGLGTRERLLLQISVILHNCGKFISLEDVSECAFNIIMATEIIGLSHVEREMIAYTVKFNTSPFLGYAEFSSSTGLKEAEYQVIAKMTAILRLVNAMDRTHRQKCKEVTVTLKDRELKLVVASQEDLSLELGTFREKAEFFEEVFNVHPVMKQKKPMI